MDWVGALDLAQTARTVRTDIFGDWHRDPWDWPELEWVVKPENQAHLVQALNASGVRRSTVLDVPKENFATRQAIIFDVVDRIIFQALVDRLSVKLIGHLPTWNYSWRLSRRAPKSGHYVDMSREWELYTGRLKNLSKTYNAALTTDISSFFSSIDPERLCDVVEDTGGSGAVVDRLTDMIMGWGRMKNRGGLPMRANAASVLASAYLRPVDDVLAQHGRPRGPRARHKRFRAARWVDDMWLFANDISALRSAQLDLQQAIESLGLTMNLGKTEVVEGDDMVAKARQLEHSAVEQALLKTPVDEEPLDALIDRIVAYPEVANHTTIRFATVRMRRHALYDRVDNLVEVASRMPHAAMALARLFRDSGAHEDLDDWFAQFSKSRWARMELAVGQFGMMFPTRTPPAPVVRDVFENAARTSPSLSLLAVAVQRLAAWDAPRARSIIQDAANKADTPNERRVLAMAALNAGETRTWVRNLLSEFEENAVTLAFLEARRFRAVRPGGDFVGF